MNTSLSIFARALATENISFSFDPNAETAGFDVKNRHLTMPLWKVSETVQTMLVAHEISHALWTPYERSMTLFDAAEKDGYCIPLLQRITNIIEDVRIEKQMKEKFPGTRRDFFLGYKEIADLDLFGFKKSDLTQAKFLTRMNIHYKWGVFGFIPVQFDGVEQQIVDAVDRVQTYEQAFDLAKTIYDHPMMKQTVEEVKQASNKSINGGRDRDGNIIKKASDQEKMLDGLIPEAADLCKHDGERYSHASITIPGITNIQHGIINSGDLLKAFDTNVQRGHLPLKMDGYREFVRHSDAYVRQLAMQFERRKAADEIRKERPKQTGQLNLDRLHQYRTHDDIFLSKIVKQEGKNHGIVFLIDFSGSMGMTISHAYQQILQLVWFCEKVKIPFEVFGFTDVSMEGMPGFHEEWEAFRANHKSYANYGDFYYSNYSKRLIESRNSPTAIKYGQTRLINLASSRDSAADRERLCAYLYEGLCVGSGNMPACLRLHGTPTVESVALASQFMVEWANENNIQIPTLMVVTDGEPNGVHTSDDTKSRAWYHLTENNALTVTNDITGTVHTIRGSGRTGTSMPNAMIGTMLDGLRTKLNARIVGMYVGGRNFNESMYQQFCLSHKESGDLYESRTRPMLNESPRFKAVAETYRDDGCIVLHDDIFPGYDAYFLIKTPQIVKDEEAIVDSGTFTKIKNTFIRTMSRRGVSRVFLSRYVDIVAGQPLRKLANGLYGLSAWPVNWCPDRK